MQVALFALSMIALAFLIAFAALSFFGIVDARKTSRLRQFSEAERDSVVFIFENEKLLAATPAARQLLDSAPRRGTVWVRLTELLGPRFPRLTEWIKDLADMGEMELKSTDGSSRLKAEWHDGVARLTLETSDAAEVRAGIDSQSYLAMSQELDSLRAQADHTPLPLWRETAAGNITWCNSAYLALADDSAAPDEVRAWPPAVMFDLSEARLPGADPGAAPELHRVAVTPDGDRLRHWYDVSVSPLPGGDRFCAALPADRLVKAETSLREFVTTLTKTFAALPIGLAIFDRARELTLFNPALMDLTVLPADFLISRPSLSAFLDRLREARMMPEPRDYKTWRQQMSALVEAAENGSYEETWSLPTGQTYRVTGRPHPDGAVALLFEDISAEISVTRRFRAELETGQAALDALPQAVAVVTANGVLSITNAAYARLWGRDPSISFEDVTLADALRGWRANCAPSPIWDRLRAFTETPSNRDVWNARIAMNDGRMLLCQVSPLTQGATMIAFSRAGLAIPTNDRASGVPDLLAEVGTGR